MLQTTEDAVFRTQVVKDFSNYHWTCYGKYPILSGLLFHILYIVFMILYIDRYYQLKLPHDDCKIYLWLMIIPMAFSFLYDSRQFLSEPKIYFDLISNRIDFLNLIFGFVNIFVQLYVGRDELYQKIIFILVVAISL